MEQRNKIDSLKSEIQQKLSEIEKLMIQTIKNYGGEIETTDGKKYKAIENSGVHFLINKFSVADDKLIVSGDFDGNVYDVGSESLYITEISEALFMILDDKSRLVQEKINKMHEEFFTKYNKVPLYAACRIMYLDGYADECDVKIKLSADLDINDDDIHYYCNSSDDLKYLTIEGCEEFILTDIYELTQEINGD